MACRAVGARRGGGVRVAAGVAGERLDGACRWTVESVWAGSALGSRVRYRVVGACSTWDRSLRSLRAVVANSTWQAVLEVDLASEGVEVASWTRVVVRTLSRLWAVVPLRAGCPVRVDGAVHPRRTRHAVFKRLGLGVVRMEARWARNRRQLQALSVVDEVVVEGQLPCVRRRSCGCGPFLAVVVGRASTHS